MLERWNEYLAVPPEGYRYVVVVTAKENDKNGGLSFLILLVSTLIH